MSVRICFIYLPKQRQQWAVPSSTQLRVRETEKDRERNIFFPITFPVSHTQARKHTLLPLHRKTVLVVWEVSASSAGRHSGCLESKQTILFLSWGKTQQVSRQLSFNHHWNTRKTSLHWPTTVMCFTVSKDTFSACSVFSFVSILYDPFITCISKYIKIVTLLVLHYVILLIFKSINKNRLLWTSEILSLWDGDALHFSDLTVTCNWPWTPLGIHGSYIWGIL